MKPEMDAELIKVILDIIVFRRGITQCPPAICICVQFILLRDFDDAGMVIFFSIRRGKELSTKEKRT